MGKIMINITNKNKTDCCGCTSCASVCPKSCIKMVEDSEGFKYPSVNMDLCINCGLCEKVCPIITKSKEADIVKAYIARNKNADILKNSSSGGLVTPMYKRILLENGIVYGCAYDNEFNVVHTYAESIEDLEKFRGSKYVQSDLSDTYKKIKQQLDGGRKVMFTGTPCQCAGLTKFLRKPYENLFTVDFVCHGVPSPLVWKKYKEIMTKKYKAKITYANFREKTYGYHSANLAMRYANGKKSAENTNTDYLMKSFFDGICSRPSCYDCSFKTVSRASDITVFDCWNISRYVKDMADDDKGYTAVIIQNEKGNKMFDKIRDDITYYETDIDLLIKYDGFMAVKSADKHPKRKDYFDMLENGASLDKAVQTYIPIKFSRKVFGKLRSVLYKTGLLKILKKLK